MKLFDDHSIDKDNMSPNDWREASEYFALGASGDVKCYKGEILLPYNDYEGTEKDVIEKNHNIDSITEVDNITGNSIKAIHTRNLETTILEDSQGNIYTSDTKEQSTSQMTSSADHESRPTGKISRSISENQSSGLVAENKAHSDAHSVMKNIKENFSQEKRTSRLDEIRKRHEAIKAEPGVATQDKNKRQEHEISR